LTGPLSQRVAVVTGASAGIGRAIATDLARAGAGVVLNARRADRVHALAAEISAAGGRALTAAGDGADERVIGAMLDAARSGFGSVPDLVVVNAGRGLNGSVVTSDPSQWEEMIRTNLLGAARLIRASAHAMLADVEARDSGQPMRRPRDIVVIGSVVGRHVSPFSSMYGSTKFGVHGMTEGVRRELAPKGVRVTLIEPGFVVSEFQGVAGYTDAWFASMVEKFGPMLEPADVARTVRFVCEQPPHVHVSDVLIRPSRQEYP
jgi:NADP-dependent 3-hydroxy acid dehydrogenase YdfG